MLSTFLLQHEGGDGAVPLGVLGVQQHQHQVKAAEQRTGQGHVDRQRLLGVVLALGVGGRQDGAARVQLAHHTDETGQRDWVGLITVLALSSSLCRLKPK